MAKCFALRVHVTQSYGSVLMMSAFSIRTFRLGGAVVLSYNSGPNRLRHARMRRIRRSISSERSASSWIMPPRYYNYQALGMLVDCGDEIMLMSRTTTTIANKFVVDVCMTCIDTSTIHIYLAIRVIYLIINHTVDTLYFNTR